MDDVHNATKVLFFADGKCERNNCSAKNSVSAFHRGSEICSFLIQLGYHHHSGKDKFIGKSPRFLGLHFDAIDAINNHQATVGYAKSRTCVGYKCSISGCINKVNLGIAMVEMGECRV